MAKLEKNDLKGAYDDFTKAISLKSDYAFSYNNRASAQYKMKKYKDAEADCNKAIQLNPNYGEAYYNRAVCKEQALDVKGSCADFSKASELGYAPAKPYTFDCMH
jgi:tetratricopeptide (TPR) repeat protein